MRRCPGCPGHSAGVCQAFHQCRHPPLSSQTPVWKLLCMPELRHLIGVQGILKNEGTLRSCNSLIKVSRLLPDSWQLLDFEYGRVNRQASPSAPVQVRKEAQGRPRGVHGRGQAQPLRRKEGGSASPGQGVLATPPCPSLSPSGAPSL